mmetsp:Transcript_103256/g.154741  ORF Transcript_103256/g.154741 Transcript_103256/m.154741 type:complete len:82 (+) Transcript_103256:640-885(+)
MYKLNEGEDRIEKFDQSKIHTHTGKIKLMREICIPMLKVPNGNYILISSAKVAGSEGDFVTNIYFDCKPDEEIILSKVGSE